MTSDIDTDEREARDNTSLASTLESLSLKAAKTGLERETPYKRTHGWVSDVRGCPLAVAYSRIGVPRKPVSHWQQWTTEVGKVLETAFIERFIEPAGVLVASQWRLPENKWATGKVDVLMKIDGELVFGEIKTIQKFEASRGTARADDIKQLLTYLNISSRCDMVINRGVLIYVDMLAKYGLPADVFGTARHSPPFVYHEIRLDQNIKQADKLLEYLEHLNSMDFSKELPSPRCKTKSDGFYKYCAYREVCKNTVPDSESTTSKGLFEIVDDYVVMNEFLGQKLFEYRALNARIKDMMNSAGVTSVHSTRFGKAVILEDNGGQVLTVEDKKEA